MSLNRLPTRLEGLIHLAPAVHADERGFFLETYSREAYREAGVLVDFIQDNHSRSTRRTIRGPHYQRRPGQSKLIRVVRGRIWDVAVDIRPSSPTFGQWEAVYLDDESHHQLFVPSGFAHGFCVLSDVADVAYKVSAAYDAQEERGIAWNDPDLGIPWPIDQPSLSHRDQTNPRLDAVPADELTTR